MFQSSPHSWLRHVINAVPPGFECTFSFLLLLTCKCVFHEEICVNVFKKGDEFRINTVWSFMFKEVDALDTSGELLFRCVILANYQFPLVFFNSSDVFFPLVSWWLPWRSGIKSKEKVIEALFRCRWFVSSCSEIETRFSSRIGALIKFPTFSWAFCAFNWVWVWNQTFCSLRPMSGRGDEGRSIAVLICVHCVLL